MKYFAGLDVSLNETAICVVDEEGIILKEGSVPSEPDDIMAWLHALEVVISRAGLEIGGLSRWLYEELRAAGLQAFCIDPRKLRGMTKTMPVKSDRNDARAIAKARGLVFDRSCEESKKPGNANASDQSANAAYQADRH